MHPGLRLRQARENLGLTYRDVERSSLELAARRGRPDFILHISRLADIENRGVVPGLHKLYSLSVIYHLDPLEISRWYEVPFDDFFSDGATFPPHRTHPVDGPRSLSTPLRFDPAFDPRRTELLSRMVERWGELEALLTSDETRHRYGYVGLSDRRMYPLLRPGSIVLVDITDRRIEDGAWSSEYDRPMYFVEVRDGYRCSWFHQAGNHIVLQPHPLSHCLPESWTVPEQAQVLGRVVGLVTRLDDPWSILPRESPAMRSDSNGKAL